MSKVRMVIWSSYFMYPVRQSKVQGMPMARNSQNTILYLCSVGRRILRMHYLRYDEQDSRVVGGGVPDAKAEGVGGQEEEDNVEGEEGTDGDWVILSQPSAQCCGQHGVKYHRLPPLKMLLLVFGIKDRNRSIFLSLCAV